MRVLFVFANSHSQTTEVPECPPQSDTVWSGYSLISVQGDARVVGQDLGKMLHLLIHCCFSDFCNVSA